MADPGDVVVVYFPDAVGSKTRPAVVVSTGLYHAHRPDIIVRLLTTQIQNATTPTNYILLDWAAAGLHHPSAFRSFLITLQNGTIPAIGRLSERDWQGVLAALALALPFPPPPSQ
jgi:mRNA interferase MazF